MKFICLFYLILLLLDLDEAFFLYHDKEPIFLCLKICPLYCSKRQKRDTGTYYWEDDGPEYPYSNPTSYEDIPFLGHVVFWKPKPTTRKPTTTTTEATTKEPTYICMLCNKKCG